MRGAQPKSYRWLSVGALVALALAAFVAVVAVRRAGEEHRRAHDVKAQAERAIQRIEARLNALENEAAADQ
ncbi:hypothetical protein ACNFJ7_09315 [Sphingomonas sp. HT-1]|uniref:hypothetical protein n=1 Tax=unclassified Sphingomonas TaxID=196159 RepID=UPI0003169E37|nr:MULTISPECIES: hypothetical protein [unclassified Sphingomonas]